MNHWNRNVQTLGVIAGLAMGAGLASAQQETTPQLREKVVEGQLPVKVAEGQLIERRADFDPAVFRERLVRRLVELEHETARLRNALEKIDQGGAPDEALELLRPTIRARVDGGPLPRALGHGDAPEHHGEIHRRGPGGPDAHGSPMRIRERILAGEPLTDEERKTLVEFLEANTPRVAAHLEELSTEHPQAAEMMLREVQRRMEGLREVAADDPAALEAHLKALRTDMELRQAAMDFVRARRAADEAAQAEARAAIETLVPARVEATLAERERELVAMRERIARLEAELAAARADPQEMIAKRLDELLQRLENAPLEEMTPRRRTPVQD